jgi:hypothetical protein
MGTISASLKKGAVWSHTVCASLPLCQGLEVECFWVKRRFFWISISAVDAGMPSKAEAVIRNFSFHSPGSVKRHDFHSVKMSSSITDYMIEDGLTKAVVGNFSTWISRGLT